MYPPSPYARPRGSFETEVTPPVGDPAATPTLTLSISCAWLPVIRGALKQLLLESTWKVDTVEELQIVQGRAFDLIDLFQDCSGSDVPFACPFGFVDSDQGWSLDIDSNLSPDHRGVYVTSSGWQTTEAHVISVNYEIRSVRIKLVFASAVNVRAAVLQYNLVKGNFDATGSQNGILLYNGGSLVASQLVEASTDPDGTAKILTYSGSGVMVDEMQLVVTCGSNAGTGNPGGGAVITYFELDGVGDNPCS